MSPVHDFEAQDDDSAEAPNADEGTGHHQGKEDPQ